MEIISTIGFDTQTTNGVIQKTTLAIAPTVTSDGVIQNAPQPQNGVLWLVNARVFGASDRTDFVMFDNAQTVRNSEGLAIKQGGYIMRDGSTHSFK